jgi:hypothetical protein
MFVACSAQPAARVVDSRHKAGVCHSARSLGNNNMAVLGPVDWSAVGSISTALALIVGAGTLFWQHRSQRRRDEWEASKFALDSCLQSFQTALCLLEDGNNDRITWITAARIIQRGSELSELVSVAPHIALLEVERELFRERAADVLGLDNPLKGEWFFRGLECPQGIEAFVTVQANQKRFSSRSRSRLPELSTASVATVYKLASYPANYDEPLVEESAGLRAGIEMRTSFPGLFNFLASNPGRDRTANGDVA